MKTITLFVMMMYVNIIILHGQLKQNDFFIGGSSNGSLYFGEDRVKNDDNNFVSANTASWGLNVPAGYFLIEAWAVGITPGYHYDYRKEINRTKRKHSTLILSPFTRYYFLRLFPRIDAELFVQGSFGFARTKEKTETIYRTYIDRYNQFTHQLGGGVAFFIHDIVSVDALIGYRSTYTKQINDNESNERNIQNDVGFSGGITIYFKHSDLK